MKRVIRYLKTTAGLGICYKRNGGGLRAFSDADWANDVDTRRSTTGYILLLNGGPAVWKSQKQSVIALSTLQAEYVAASVACREILWARHFLPELGWRKNDLSPLFVDN